MRFKKSDLTCNAQCHPKQWQNLPHWGCCCLNHQGSEFAVPSMFSQLFLYSCFPQMFLTVFACGSQSSQSIPLFSKLLSVNFFVQFLLCVRAIFSSVLIKLQPAATVCRYLFTAKSLYMFRVSQHPSSGVLKTVTAASSTGHTVKYRC